MFLEDLEACLTRTGLRVGVFTGPDDSDLPGFLESHPSSPQVTTVAAAEPDAFATLAVLGKFDVLIDDTRHDKGRADLFRDTFLHLRKGGTFLVREATADGPAVTDADDGTHLADLLGEIARGRLTRPSKLRTAAAANARFAAAVGSLTIRAGHVVATNRAPARAILRDEQTNTWLAQRGPDAGHVVDVRPGAAFASRAVVHESGSPRAGRLPTDYEAPAVSLRVYRNATCLPGQIAWCRNVVLPDSFRHNQGRDLRNRHLPALGTRFARTPDHAAPEPLRGAYFYLDSEFRGHFGHAMTEQLSRLWAWKQAKAADPDLQALLLSRSEDGELARYEVDLYGAAGIAREDLVLRHGPVRVESLVAATPMFSQPAYVHPDLTALWRTVSDNLAGRAPDRDYPRRIFCARRGSKRACHNAAVVERLFVEHGFTVVYTEDHSMAEQARMFREAEAIGGYAGSALFNACLSGGPKRLFMVSSESYTAQNEYMMSAALGHELNIAWCEADLPLRGPGFVKEVFHSAFTFNPSREGEWLRERLRTLT